MQKLLEETGKQTQESIKLCDDFNSTFANNGWIAYESFNSEAMKNAMFCFHSNGMNAAEEVLLKYYSATELSQRIHLLLGSKHFEPWESILNTAFQRYQQDDYISGIPLLLMVADGVVNNTNMNDGLFSKQSAMEVWDSIAGHSSGLKKVKSIMAKGRRKTNTDPIYLPYRNGILHGRDVNYGNQAVAAKCWGILFAVKDWADSFLNEHERKLKYAKKHDKKSMSLGDLIHSLKNRQDDQAHSEEMLKQWKPRDIHIGVNIPETGDSNVYTRNSPEHCVALFISMLNKQNYKSLSELIDRGYDGNGDKGKGALRNLRNAYKQIKDVTFQILSIDDNAASVTEIMVRLWYQRDGMCYVLDNKYRLIYMVNGTPAVRGEEGGTWKIVTGYAQIQYQGDVQR